MTRETAIFAGGCFWCTEAVFQSLEGVDGVESGYIGGHAANPTYKQVCGGDTGHAEAIRISFDPSVISYADLLDVFFRSEEHTSELQSLMRISYAVFCLKKKTNNTTYLDSQ